MPQDDLPPAPAVLAQAVAGLSVWSRGDERAPHKPLLLLYVLARIQRGEPRLVSFVDVETCLGPLLKQVLSQRATHVEYPFWYLRTDGVWQVEGAAAAVRRAGTSIPLRAELRQMHGGMPADQDQWLRANPAGLVHLARQLLDAHFPETLHQDLCDDLGLSLQEPAVAAGRQRRPRDPRFRALVLRAYEFRCAVCGFDGRMDTTIVGLEAAHVRWHEAAGPDTEDNGLALCCIHQKLFDLGVFSLTPARHIAVSDLLNRSVETTDLMLRHHNQPLRGPRDDKAPIADAFRHWHWQQVFKKPARVA